MSVRGLGIRFKTAQGVWQATRKIDFDVAPGERVGIVGESGCGKTITGLSILRLLPNNLAGLDGSIMFGGDRPCLLQHARDARDPRQAHRHDLPGADERARSGVHGRPPDRRDAAHPHRAISKDEARAKTHRHAAARRHRLARAAHRRLSASAVRRHAPAGDDRRRPDLRAAAADRRRADHRARRDRAGADPRTAARPQRHLARPR